MNNKLKELGKLLIATAATIGASYCVVECVALGRQQIDALTREALASEIEATNGVALTIRYVSRRYGVDYRVVEAMIAQESNFRLDAMRYEPALAERFARRGVPSYEVTPWATSFGLLQVIYGFHKDRCKLSSPIDLFDAKTNLECGVSYLKECLGKGKDLRGALVCYNGGSEGYADQVLSRLGSRMVS